MKGVAQFRCISSGKHPDAADHRADGSADPGWRLIDCGTCLGHSLHGQFLEGWCRHSREQRFLPEPGSAESERAGGRGGMVVLPGLAEHGWRTHRGITTGQHGIESQASERVEHRACLRGIHLQHHPGFGTKPGCDLFCADHGSPAQSLEVLQAWPMANGNQFADAQQQCRRCRQWPAILGRGIDHDTLCSGVCLPSA